MPGKHNKCCCGCPPAPTASCAVTNQVVSWEVFNATAARLLITRPDTSVDTVVLDPNDSPDTYTIVGGFTSVSIQADGQFTDINGDCVNTTVTSLCGECAGPPTCSIFFGVTDNINFTREITWTAARNNTSEPLITGIFINGVSQGFTDTDAFHGGTVIEPCLGMQPSYTILVESPCGSCTQTITTNCFRQGTSHVADISGMPASIGEGPCTISSNPFQYEYEVTGLSAINGSYVFGQDGCLYETEINLGPSPIVIQQDLRFTDFFGAYDVSRTFSGGDLILRRSANSGGASLAIVVVNGTSTVTSNQTFGGGTTTVVDPERPIATGSTTSLAIEPSCSQTFDLDFFYVGSGVGVDYPVNCSVCPPDPNDPYAPCAGSPINPIGTATMTYIP